MRDALETKRTWFAQDVLPAFVYDTSEVLKTVAEHRGLWDPQRLLTRLAAYQSYYADLFEQAIEAQLPPSRAHIQEAAVIPVAQIFKTWLYTVKQIALGLQHEDLTIDNFENAWSAARALGDFANAYAEAIGGDLTVELPASWQGRIEGMQVEVVLDVPEQNKGAADAAFRTLVQPLVETAFRGYKRRAEKIFPWVLRNTPPIEIYLGDPHQVSWAAREVLPLQGLYNFDRIRIYAMSLTADPHELLHTLAHEEGHAVWRQYLSSKQKKFWSESMQDDLVPLELIRVYAMWSDLAHETGDDSLGYFVEMLRQVDPILAGQVHDIVIRAEGKFPDTPRGLRSLIYDQGIASVDVPANPITPYASTNAEEGFCEAFGLVFAYGPRRTPAKVRQWLSTMLPELKISDSPSLYGPR